MRSKKIISQVVALAAAATMSMNFGSLSVLADTVVANDNGVKTTADQETGYKYLYAGLSWAEYWKSENVFLSGTDLTASSTEQDARKELDKGAFDTVTRATTNHGLHRGSFQCNAQIYDEEGNVYKISHWSADGKTVYLTDGTAVGYNKGQLTLPDNSVHTLQHYEVLGLKYVPVKVAAKDYEDFKSKYVTVENGGTLVGGYGEGVIPAYSETAEVTADTNGLKTAEKQADGTYTFSARTEGKNSGIKDAEQKKAEQITVTVKGASDAEAYGAFVRVDLNGDDYGSLGANMQAVKWEYYGNDATCTKKLATYGTKFAADNWMHKSMGIQLGLTDSLRCKLPQGTDGTGYWKLTLYALGYEDYTTTVEVKEENIGEASEQESDTTALAEAIKKAKALKESDYTAKSWADMQAELQEAEDQMKDPGIQAVVDEATQHLTAAIAALVKVPQPAKMSISKLTAGNTDLTVTWAKNTKVTGYEIRYSEKSDLKSAKNIKITKNTVSSYKISKLPVGKKYYVQIRSYINANNTTYVGSWSATKSISTAKYDLKKAVVSGVTSKTYTGKSQTQKITVKYAGKTLKNGTDYSVSYANNKSIGSASVKITGKGNYTGSVTKKFVINPTKQSVKKVAANKKAFTITWTKNTLASGYEVQYATNNKFAGVKKITVSNKNTTSKTVSKLSSKKKYYVRVRTYKTVKGVKYYGAWSSAKSVVTK